MRTLFYFFIFNINKKNFIIGFLVVLPFLMLSLIKFVRCGDTSNFWGANFAGVKTYYLKIVNQSTNDIWSEVIEDVNKKVHPPFNVEKALIMLDLKPYYIHMRDYERKRIIEMINERKQIILVGIFKFLFYNPGALLFTQP